MARTLLGDDNDQSMLLVREQRRLMKERWPAAFDRVRELEMDIFGENSFFRDVERRNNEGLPPWEPTLQALLDEAQGGESSDDNDVDPEHEHDSPSDTEAADTEAVETELDTEAAETELETEAADTEID